MRLNRFRRPLALRAGVVAPLGAPPEHRVDGMELERRDGTMADEQNQRDEISTLNSLIETCRDGENGFHTAAQDSQDARTRALFESYSQQRAEFAMELEGVVRRLGGDPAASGHVAGALHRGWINLKAAVTGKDTRAVLNEAERGEDYAVRAYEAALKAQLPSDVRLVVERQYLQVKEAHDHVRALRDAKVPR
jgi:uncharacterized protein (TIGR02284 family)